MRRNKKNDRTDKVKWHERKGKERRQNRQEVNRRVQKRRNELRRKEEMRQEMRWEMRRDDKHDTQKRQEMNRREKMIWKEGTNKTNEMKIDHETRDKVRAACLTCLQRHVIKIVPSH